MKGLSKMICWSALVCTLSGNEAATEITLGRLKLPFNFCSVHAAFGAHTQTYDRWGYVHTCTIRPAFGTCSRGNRPSPWWWWGRVMCPWWHRVESERPSVLLILVQSSCLYMRLLVYTCTHTTYGVALHVRPDFGTYRCRRPSPW